eukprot:1791735-Rhodomonas_salina.1
MQSAQSRDTDARAWSKAYDFIINTLHGWRLLDNSIMDEAVLLAESHMQQGEADAAAFQTHTPDSGFEELEAKMN